jgi:tellurite methyltransferase
MTDRPEDFIVRFQGRIRKGSEVLDIGCGRGRHALFLARAGCRVLAMDRSTEKLAVLEAQARDAGLALTTIEANVESMSLIPNQVDVIVNTLFLYRPLFVEYSRALRPGGLLFFSTFTAHNLEVLGHQRPGPEYLLSPGELRDSFPDLKVDFYDESVSEGRAMATLVASREETVTEYRDNIGVGQNGDDHASKQA